MVFVPVVEHWTSSIGYRVLEGSWEFAQPVHMCFVDLEKACWPLQTRTFSMYWDGYSRV